MHPPYSADYFYQVLDRSLHCSLSRPSLFIAEEADLSVPKDFNRALWSTSPERGWRRQLEVRLGVRPVSAVRSGEKIHFLQKVPCCLDLFLAHIVEPVDV